MGQAGLPTLHQYGRIAFDSKLCGGGVRKSNALELMRSLGLRV